VGLRLHFTLNENGLRQKSWALLLQSRADPQRINFASLYKSIHLFLSKTVGNGKMEMEDTT